jgi:hypothetical protein
MTPQERIENLIKELEQGNAHTNSWIIEELKEILNTLNL